MQNFLQATLASYIQKGKRFTDEMYFLGLKTQVYGLLPPGRNHRPLTDWLRTSAKSKSSTLCQILCVLLVDIQVYEA